MDSADAAAPASRVTSPVYSLCVMRPDGFWQLGLPFKPTTPERATQVLADLLASATHFEPGKALVTLEQPEGTLRAEFAPL